MKAIKLIFFLGLSLSMIQVSHGALTKECADKLYKKYYDEHWKEFMKHREKQIACFPAGNDPAALPLVDSTSPIYPTTISAQTPFNELLALKPAHKDHFRLNFFFRYPDFSDYGNTYNEETKKYESKQKVTNFKKEAYDCAMENAKKSNEELKKFYAYFAKEINTNCGASDPVKSASQLEKEIDTYWYNAINYRFKQNGEAKVYPFAIDPKFVGSFSGKSKLSFVREFDDVDGKIVPREPYVIDINCKSNKNESAWLGTFLGRDCSEIEKMVEYAAKTNKIHPDRRQSSMVYYKGIKSIAMPSSPVAEKKEAKPSTDVDLVKTGAKTAEVRTYGNLYYDDNGNLVKGLPTQVTPVQCDGSGMPSCSDVLKDFEKAMAKTPSYIVDKATAMNTLLYEKPTSSSESNSNSSGATGSTPVAAAPVKTPLPGQASEVELIDNGDGTAKLMIFNDFYYNQKGELVRSEASQVTTVQCGKNKSVTCDQVLAEAKAAMKNSTGYLVDIPASKLDVAKPNVSISSVSTESGTALQLKSRNSLDAIMNGGGSGSAASLSCDQNQLPQLSTDLQAEIEAVKQEAIKKIEAINAKYKVKAEALGCVAK